MMPDRNKTPKNSKNGKGEIEKGRMEIAETVPLEPNIIIKTGLLYFGSLNVKGGFQL